MDRWRNGSDCRVEQTGWGRWGRRFACPDAATSDMPLKCALILGASSGFGEAVALELATAGYNIYGVHLDRRETLPNAAAIQQKIQSTGARSTFFNINAADEEKRREVIARIQSDEAEIAVLLHSLAFGALRPLAASPEAASQRQLEMTADVMGHRLLYWTRD